MAYYCNGKYLSEEWFSVIPRLTSDQEYQLMMDFMESWPMTPTEMIASGMIFKWKPPELLESALKRIRDTGVSYGGIEWRDERPKKAKASGNAKARPRATTRSAPRKTAARRY